jgi:hypothetical protein
MPRITACRNPRERQIRLPRGGTMARPSRLHMSGPAGRGHEDRSTPELLDPPVHAQIFNIES